MAKCDQGYLCEVCGEEVPNITVSDLYLRYILGEIGSRQLMSAPERHLHCNPTLAQFITDPAFPPITVDGPSTRRMLALYQRPFPMRTGRNADAKRGASTHIKSWIVTTHGIGMPRGTRSAGA